MGNGKNAGDPVTTVEKRDKKNHQKKNKTDGSSPPVRMTIVKKKGKLKRKKDTRQ